MRAVACAALLLAVTAHRFSRPADGKYNTSSRRSAVLTNFWLIPHTHDDLGWVVTPDQAYAGVANGLYMANVKYILDSIVVALLKNPDRKMIYNEQGFFTRWWREQTDGTKATVRSLVAEGRLQMINGGWAQHDEANPNFLEMLDNTAVGQRAIVDMFNEAALPNVTWQIDPFGQSSFQGVMSSPAAGFGGVFWARLSVDDRKKRVAEKSMEMLWMPSSSTKDSIATFAHAFRIHYSAPQGFSFDIQEKNVDKIQDDPMLDEYNVNKYVDNFVKMMTQTYQPAYDGTDVLVTFGDDVMYANADMYFSNLDKLIHYVNLDGRINLLYATPAEFLTAKLQDPNFALSTNAYDFMPLEDDGDNLWTGYFTSRVGLKGYIRESSAIHTAARQVQMFTSRPPSPNGVGNPLFQLDTAVATTMHHDAITGTELDGVSQNYAQHLASGRAEAFSMLANSTALMTKYTPPSGTTWEPCDLMNVTVCKALSNPAVGTSTVVQVWNSDSVVRNISLRLAVPSALQYTITGAAGQTLTAQTLALSPEDVYLRGVYKGDAQAMTWLAVIVPSVPAIGYTVIFITPTSSTTATGDEASTHASISETFIYASPDELELGPLRGMSGSAIRSRAAAAAAVLAPAASTTITNGIITLTFDMGTGGLMSYANAATGVSVPLSVDLAFYNGSQSTNYMFTPGPRGAPNPDPAQSVPIISLTFVRGPVVSEARQVMAWGTVTVRLWAGDASAVQFEYTAGPLPCQDYVSREVILRYNVTGWTTAGRYATDSNCREMQPRVRNSRPTFNSTMHSPVADYPVSCGISTTDSTGGDTLIVSPDRPLGAASLADGSLELHIHRRIIHGDGFTWLNETGQTGAGLIVRGLHSLAIAGPSAAATTGDRFTREHLFRPLVLFASYSAGTPATWLSAYVGTFAGLNEAALPANVAVATVQSLSPTTLLLRLAHMFEITAPAPLSSNGTVAIGNLFTGVSVLGVVEQTMVGTRALSSTPSWSYRVKGNAQPLVLPIVPPAPTAPAYSVTLSAMQIRAFLITTAV